MRVRLAIKNDLLSIVKMIADDPLGAEREQFTEPLPDSYLIAFEKIMADEDQELVVIADEKDEVMATLQLSFIQYLTYRGGIRAQIEAVRVRNDKQGQGIGKFMIEWAIERARERNAHLVQLTTDKGRPQAIEFYSNLGFTGSHEGMKLHLVQETK